MGDQYDRPLYFSAAVSSYGRPYVVMGRPLSFTSVISFFFFMAAHSNGQAIIFLPCDFFSLLSSSSFIFFLYSPDLSGRGLDVYHTSTNGVALVRI